ncbi:dTDP-4-dehydrorhamnose reductase [Aurantivibrio plasticivorans]
MKILILGANGQVGWELQRACAVLGECVAWNRHHCDLEHIETLEQKVLREAPDVLINAAAYTAVDKAESDKEAAFILNRDVPGILARCMRQVGGWLIHYSTDYVFDGKKKTPYLESDTPNPLSVYGETKLAGEQAIVSSTCQYIIFRTSWVYGLHGINFPKTMLRLAQSRDQLSVVNDQFGAPTSAELIADVTAHVVRAITDKIRAEEAYSGLYHLVAGGKTNWHEFASNVIERAGNSGLPIKVAAENINAIPSSDYPVAAERPINSCLSNEKLQSMFSLSLPHWKDHVERFVREYVERGMQ